MAAYDSLNGKYFFSSTGDSGSWNDFADYFTGLKILKISGFNDIGDAVNIFTQQWTDTQKEDVMVTTKKRAQQQRLIDWVIRENVDLTVSFIVSERYNPYYDPVDPTTHTQHLYSVFADTFNHVGIFYIYSAYARAYAKVALLKGIKITTEKLNRGKDSYILGTMTLHIVDRVIRDVGVEDLE